MKQIKAEHEDSEVKARNCQPEKRIKLSRDYGTKDGKTHDNILAQLQQFRLKDELKVCGEFPRYCPARINGVHTFAFMDSGNCLPNVISEEFAQKLGFSREQLKPVPKLQTVGTAKAASELTVLGTTPAALKLRLGGSQRRIPFRPLVIESLSMEVNLSGPFMRRARIDQLHSEGVLCVDGTKVPLLTRRQCKEGLLAALTAPDVDPDFCSTAYVAKKVVVPPKTLCYLPLRVSSLDQLQMSAKSGTVEVDPSFAFKTGVDPLQLTITKPDSNGNIWTSVWNTTDSERIINEDMKFGQFDNSPETYLFAMFNDPMEKGEISQEMEDPTDPKVLEKKERLAQERVQRIDKKQLERTIQEFRLNESPVLNQNPELKEQAAKLLIEFDDIMGRGDRIGRTTLVEHDIDTGDLPPIRLKARPLNPVQEEDLKRQLKKWLEQGIIKEGTSEWRFPMVPAFKKGTEQLRWATDLRYVNKATKADSFQLPDMSDNLARLSKSKVFSALDCSGAFLNVPLTKRAQERCCFGTPLGTYIFLFMPFGLTNAPATFSRLMQKVFDGIPSSEALVFLDDALAHSACPNKHLEILRKIFARYRYAGLTLQPRKTHLFKEEVDYLGYHISESGLSVVPEYVEVVKNWPLPTTAKEVQIFLGKAGYYRRFIKDYSEFAGPLSEYLKVAHAENNYHSKIKLTAKAKDCFQQLKERLCSAPILAFPDFYSSEPFILDTDFSGGSIGAVLSQVQEGKERVIAYGAKKLLPRETNYSSNKGELLAVVYFIEKFKYFLSHRKFILRTDHQALMWLTTMKCPKGMYSRWQELLAHYDFEVRFRKGDKHGNADCLSRIQHATGGDLETCPSIHSVQLLPTDKLTAGKLAELQDKDTELHDVIQWVKKRDKPSIEMERHLGPVQKAYCKLFPLLKLTPSGILVVAETHLNRERICLPEVAQERVVQLAHEMGHQGIGSTFHQIRSRFYFWNMAKKVELLVRCCTACQKKVGKGPDQRHTHKDIQVGYPGQQWAIDLVGPLEESEEGYRYLLTAKDVFTRWMEAIPLIETDAESIARELEKEVFSRHGLPEQVHSDNAHNISGTVIQEICQQLGVRKTVTPDYNPKSNPVERMHRDLGNSLKAVMEETNQEWVSCLPAVLLALRTTRCRSTGFTPFFLTYGREACLPVDVAMGKEPSHKLGPVQYANELYQRMQAAFRFARETQGATIEKTKSYYQDQVSQGEFDEGKLVWLYTPRIKKGESRKLHSSWTGPWVVVNKVSEVLRRIRTQGDWNRRILEVVASVDRLKEYREARQPPQLTVRDDLTWEDVAVEDEEIDNGILRGEREKGVTIQPQIQIQIPNLPAEIVDLKPPPTQTQNEEVRRDPMAEHRTQPPFNPQFMGDAHREPEILPSAPEENIAEDMDESSNQVESETNSNTTPESESHLEELPPAPTLPPKKKPLTPRSLIVPQKRGRVKDSSTDSTSSPTEEEIKDKPLRRSARIRWKRLTREANRLIEDPSTSTTTDISLDAQPVKRPKKKVPRKRLSKRNQDSLHYVDYPFVIRMIQEFEND